MQLIIDFVDDKKDHLCTDMKNRLESGERYTMTANNKRYINLNLHGQEGFTDRLGLVRVLGSFTSERNLDGVQKQLQQFGVHIENHCVTSVTERV